MGITRFGLKRPISALMIILTIVMFGVASFIGRSVELIPEVTTPVLMVHTVYEGADPETVDVSVSQVIEETGETLNGIQRIQSYSYENYSLVMLQYEHGTDSMSNYMKLQNALAEVKLLLPEGCKEPVIIEMDVKATPSLKISAHGEDENEVLAFLNEGVLAEIENLPSVAKVDVFGGKIDYIRVELQPELLKQYGLNLESVAEYMAAANFSVPIGNVEQGNQTLGVTSSAKSTGLQDIKDLPLRSENSGMIRLEDIADVSWAVKNADSISHFNGEANVTISITKSQRASSLELSKQVGEVLEKYEARNHQVEFDVFYDSGEEISSAVKTLGIVLLAGFLLAMLVVFLFFGNVKSALTVAISVVLSLLLTMIGMNLTNLTMNVVTMGALIIAAGFLIETSIVVMETCFKICRDCSDVKDAVVEAAKTVRNALIVSVAVTVAVCLPFAFLKGFSAQLFVPLAYVIAFAAIASLVNAAVFVPLLFVLLKPQINEQWKLLKKLEMLENLYEKVMKKIMARKDIVLSATIFLIAVSCATLIYTDRELVSESNQEAVKISVDFRAGMQVSEIEKKLIVLEELLEEYQEVESYSTTISGSSADIQVKLKNESRSAYEKFREKIKKRTEDYVGIDIRVSNVSNLSELQTKDAEELIISGYRLEDVKVAAKQLADRFRKIPGAMSVISSVETEGTKLEIMVDPMMAMNFGLTSAEVAEKLQEMVRGQEVMTIEEEERSYGVCLEYPEGIYSTPQNLMYSEITTPDGLSVPLAEIAQLHYTDAQECIVRRDGKYLATLTVTCSEKYRDDVRAGMEKAWSKLNTTATITREKSEVEELVDTEFKSLFYAIAVALFLVFVVLTIRYESIKYALTMMLSIPLALSGAFLLMFITGSSWDLVSLIGILLLIEMIIYHCIRYMENTKELLQTITLEEALIVNGKEMLRSMTLAALAVICAVLPLAVWPGTGTALISSMAVVIIGGMFGGTGLLLFVLPVICQFLYGEEDNEEDEKDENVNDEGEAKEEFIEPEEEIAEDPEQIKSTDEIETIES